IQMYGTSVSGRGAGGLGDNRDATRRDRVYSLHMIDDTSRHDATSPANDPARHSMTLEEVMKELEGAGISRTLRTLQRLCERGAFDAAPSGPGGDWRVAPDSVPNVIGDLRAQDEKARLAAERRDMSRQVADEKPLNDENDMTRSVATSRDMSQP